MLHCYGYLVPGGALAFLAEKCLRRSMKGIPEKCSFFVTDGHISGSEDFPYPQGFRGEFLRSAHFSWQRDGQTHIFLEVKIFFRVTGSSRHTITHHIIILYVDHHEILVRWWRRRRWWRWWQSKETIWQQRAAAASCPLGRFCRQPLLLRLYLLANHSQSVICISGGNI